MSGDQWYFNDVRGVSGNFLGVQLVGSENRDKHYEEK